MAKQEFQPRGTQAAKRLPIVLIVAAALIGAGVLFVFNSSGAEPITVNDQTISSTQLVQGEEIYIANCAVCHGPNGDGQTNWRQPDPNGAFPAPPHNNDGHTWHHADQQLLEIIAQGGSLPDSGMPAYADTLTEEELIAVLAYIKTFWGSDELAFQTEVTRNSLRQ